MIKSEDKNEIQQFKNKSVFFRLPSSPACPASFLLSSSFITFCINYSLCKISDFPEIPFSLKAST